MVELGCLVMLIKVLTIRNLLRHHLWVVAIQLHLLKALVLLVPHSEHQLQEVAASLREIRVNNSHSSHRGYSCKNLAQAFLVETLRVLRLVLVAISLANKAQVEEVFLEEEEGRSQILEPKILLRLRVLVSGLNNRRGRRLNKRRRRGLHNQAHKPPADYLEAAPLVWLELLEHLLEVQLALLVDFSELDKCQCKEEQ